jgi:DNA-binding MarR family transcriptional regulator
MRPVVQFLNAAMDVGSRRNLEILTTIAEGRPVTQRALAARLGIALGLTNLYLKRLVRKGYVKVTTIPPNRIRYLVTPRGVAQKSRLTYEYMRYSLRLYREARQALREALRPLAQGDKQRVALYGTGEAAELAYLTLRELGVEPAAVLDGSECRGFLGQIVRPIDAVGGQEYDRIVIATLDAPDAVIAALERRGVSRHRMITLRR